MPDPILVGRREQRLRELAEEHGFSRWTSEVEAALADKYNQINFDAQTTSRRENIICQAINAGRQIYGEKPTATSTEGALQLAEMTPAADRRKATIQE